MENKEEAELRGIKSENNPNLRVLNHYQTISYDVPYFLLRKEKSSFRWLLMKGSPSTEHPGC